MAPWTLAHWTLAQWTEAQVQALPLHQAGAGFLPSSLQHTAAAVRQLWTLMQGAGDGAAGQASCTA